MQSHSALGNAVTLAAANAAPDIKSQITASLAALWAYILAGGRSLIDEPQERAAIEAEAVRAFNAFFGDKLGPAATMFIDGLITATIDRELTWLAATPVVVPVTPDPSPPAPPIGSAKP